MRWIAFAACGYELGALATGRYPTLTQVCARHRWLGPFLVAALAVHLHRQPRCRTPRDETLEAAARVLTLARHLPEQGRDEAEDVAACLLSAANRI